MIYVYLVLASVLWGLNIIVVKLNSQFLNPLFLVFLKLLISSVTMFIVIKYKKYEFNRSDFLTLIVIATLINVLNFILTYKAIPLLSGVTSATLNCLSPVIITLLTLIINKQMVDFYSWLINMVLILGFLLTIKFNIQDLSIGHYMMLLGITLYNLGNLLIKKYQDINYLVYNFYLLIISTIEMGIINLFYINDIQTKPINVYYLVLFVITAGIGYSFIQTIYIKGIESIGLLNTSFIMSLNPLFTYIFSIIIFNDELNIYSIIGFVIMILGVIFNFFVKKRRKKL